MEEIKCDRCGKMFEPDGETNFWGDVSGGEGCSPFMKLDAFCTSCWQTHEKRKDFDHAAEE